MAEEELTLQLKESFSENTTEDQANEISDVEMPIEEIKEDSKEKVTNGREDVPILSDEKPVVSSAEEEESQDDSVEATPAGPTGKRIRKKVERLAATPVAEKPKKEISFDGSGIPLGQISFIEHKITKASKEDLNILHSFVFKRRASAAKLRSNLRKFNGFTFNKDTTDYDKLKEKSTKMIKKELTTICDIVGLEKKGVNSEVGDRIIEFLMKPSDLGKNIPKKKRKSTGKKKTPKGKKSASKKARKTKKNQSETDNDSDGNDEDDNSASEDEGDESMEETPKPKSKPAAKKKTPQSKKPNKKSAAKKKVDSESEEASEEEDNESESEEKDSGAESSEEKAAESPVPKKKTKTPVKKTPKAKNVAKKGGKRARTVESDESSDDNEPLIKKAKNSPPTNGEIKTFLAKYMKTINLEEVSMRQIYQTVYDTYPKFDLTERKEFIKSTVKAMLA